MSWAIAKNWLNAHKKELVALPLSLLIFNNAQECLAQTPEAPFQGLIPEPKIVDSNGVNLLTDKASIEIPLTFLDRDATKLLLKSTLSLPGKSDADYDYPKSIHQSAREAFGDFFWDGLNIISMEDVTYDGGSPVRIISSPFGTGLYDGHTNLSVNSDGSRIRESFGDTYFTEMRFSDTSQNGVYDRFGARIEFPAPISRANAFQYPNGERIKINYYPGTTRISSIVSNKGYGVQINYVGGSISSVKSYNKALYYCDEVTFTTCQSISSLQDDVVFLYNDMDKTVTIQYPKTGESRKITFEKLPDKNFFRIKSIETIGVPSSVVTYNYGYFSFYTEGQIRETIIDSIVNSDGTWLYTYDRNNSGRLDDESAISRTAPDNSKISSSGSYMLGQGKFVDEIGRSYTTCVGSNVGRYSSPCADFSNGRRIWYQRDSRNNITHIELRPATGSTDPILHYYATYPSECLNPRTCNRPLTVTDARGGVTTYTYDPDHGGVLTEVQPADTNGVHPSRKNYYAQRYALIKNSSGGYVQSTSPLWLKTEERTCKTSALNTSAGTCSAGASDLIQTSYEYGPTMGAANNLLLRGVAITADGQTLRTCFGYDAQGRKISETKPAANLSVCP